MTELKNGAAATSCVTQDQGERARSVRLDLETEVLLDELNAIKAPSVWEVSVSQVRTEAIQQQARLAFRGPDIGEVRDFCIPGPYRDIPIRVYRPSHVAADEKLPLYINFHGSGFVVCNVDSYDHVCRILCKNANCIVAAVDYCKSPEFKFPKPIEEAWASTLWLCEHATEIGGDPSRVGVGGDSAGGCLATVVAQRALAAGTPLLVHQLLVYPVTDTDLTTPSYVNFGDGYSLTAEQLRWFFHCYFEDDVDRHDVEAAPLRAHSLQGMPPTTIILAGCDPLLSEGHAYARRLREAGVPTELYTFEGSIHGFWSATARLQTISRDAHQKAADALRRAFGTMPKSG